MELKNRANISWNPWLKFMGGMMPKYGGKVSGKPICVPSTRGNLSHLPPALPLLIFWLPVSNMSMVFRLILAIVFLVRSQDSLLLKYFW